MSINSFKENQGIRDFWRFGVVGFISTAIDIIVLNLSYHALGLNIYLATFSGYFLGAVSGYFMNAYWTYSRQNRSSHIVGLAQYTVIAFIGLGITELLIKLLSVELGWNVNAGKLVAIFIVFFWNFFVNRKVTFSEK